jgi:hypothetical protein
MGGKIRGASSPCETWPRLQALQPAACSWQDQSTFVCDCDSGIV